MLPRFFRGKKLRNCVKNKPITLSESHTDPTILFSGDNWTADLFYAPGKVIRAEGNVPQDASFLRVNINTPIEDYTTMELTYTKRPSQDHTNPMDFEVGSSFCHLCAKTNSVPILR